ncbi:hypothetical protein EV668_3290 [Enterovirga rhinocerotis]|uniref:Uncharacterized protein n=1 Tax=Enterovirga rhinocerotis TaxID=1339210 RepID=A0A4V3DXX8_9HYPH|nr:hypothetical protein EV668_3290 [Enterovirga rhinocerotis]
MRILALAPCAAAFFALMGAGYDSARAQPAPAAPAKGQVQHSPAPDVARSDKQAQGALSPAEVRELLAAMRETAKASRENVDYNRVVPDILTQILNKLDKLEDKLDKIENAVKGQAGRKR